MGQRWTFKTVDQLNSFIDYTKDRLALGKPFTVDIREAEMSVAQNQMQFALYRDIAAQREDMSQSDVRAHAKLHFGVGILKAADPEFGEWYDKHVKGMSYPAKLAMMEYMDITSQEAFRKPQMQQFLDEIIRYWSSQGVALALP